MNGDDDDGEQHGYERFRVARDIPVEIHWNFRPFA